MQDGTFKGSCPRGWTRGSPTSTGMPKGSHSQSPAEEGGCEHRPLKRRDDRDRRDRVSHPRGAFARRTDQKRRPSSRSAPTSSFVVQHGTRSCLFKLVTPAQILEELAHLVRLEAIVLDEAGPKT